MPEAEMVEIVSLANHESKINAGEKLNLQDYFLQDRKSRLPLPFFHLPTAKCTFCLLQPTSFSCCFLSSKEDKEAGGLPLPLLCYISLLPLARFV